jgi:predicted adenylyl cyclase CyaB
MKEIEILIEVLDSKENVMQALEHFQPQGLKRTVDAYFVDPLRNDLRPDSSGRLRASFRLRQKDGKASVAYKVDHFGDGDEWTYADEHETAVGDFDTTRVILDHLGLQELVRVESEKHIWTTPEYEIVFEEVKDLGLFIEVEKLEQVPDDRVAETKQGIREFLTGLGLKLGAEMNAGKPELLLKKKTQQADEH